MTEAGTVGGLGALTTGQTRGARLLAWLISAQRTEVLPKDPASTLWRAFHITAKCRYNASIRLKNLGQFSFLTATVLSLGLILLPVLRLMNIDLRYTAHVLDGLEVFLAVAVLVYSVVNSTAHYELRAEALNECGDRVKALSRELRTAQANEKADEILESMNQRYTDITSDSENHTRGDYLLAMLQAEELCKVSGLPRAWWYCKVLVSKIPAYIIPASLMAAELVIILDVIGITQILTPYLKASAPN